MVVLAAALAILIPSVDAVPRPDFASMSPSVRAEALEDWAWQDAQATPIADDGDASDQKSDDKAAADDARHQKDVERDKEVGKKYSEEADKQYKPSTDEEGVKRIQRIGAELAEIANRTHAKALWGDPRLSKFDYQFKVVEGSDVNAFSLPGGYIYVFDGLVKYAESDDEVAGVLAHEISHAAFRHVAYLQREASKVNAIQIPLILAAILAGGSGFSDAAAATTLVGQALTSGWSVKAEEAADYGGFQYLTQSNYNPVGMLTFMERLARDDRSGPAIDWGIYRTHPPSQARATAITGYLNAAHIPIRRSAVATSFRTQVVPGENHSVDLIFGRKRLISLAGKDALTRADDAAVKLNAFFDSDPQLFEVTPGADGTILGKRKALLQVTSEDAGAANLSTADLQKQTVANIKTAIYGLSFRVWPRS